MSQENFEKSYLSLLTPNSINTQAIINLHKCLAGEEIEAFNIEIYDKSLNRRSLKIHLCPYIVDTNIEGVDGLAIVLN